MCYQFTTEFRKLAGSVLSFACPFNDIEIFANPLFIFSCPVLKVAVVHSECYNLQNCLCSLPQN